MMKEKDGLTGTRRSMAETAEPLDRQQVRDYHSESLHNTAFPCPFASLHPSTSGAGAHCEDRQPLTRAEFHWGGEVLEVDDRFFKR